MAKENIAFLVNLRKNIVEGSKMEGRYYPEAESKEALTTKGFARHVADHGGMVTYEFMQLVLASIVKCLKEMMSHGQPVKLDGLGTFRPTVTSVPGGAATIEVTSWRPSRRRSTARTSPIRCVPRCRLGISSSRMTLRLLRRAQEPKRPEVMAEVTPAEAAASSLPQPILKTISPTIDFNLGAVQPGGCPQY